MNVIAFSLFADIVVGMVVVAGGEYRPLYLSEDSERISVSSFMLDITPVSNSNFYEFIQHTPGWRKNAIPTLFTENTYLGHWSEVNNVWKPDASQSEEVVINVSWFAARAYCEVQGKRLPTVAEWEFVARASESRPDGSQESGYNQRILDWYAMPNLNAVIGQTPNNYWGVKDLHGLIWEWTEDFNSNLISGESRADASIDTKLYCAAASADAADPSDYAAFMRYGFRSSLQARFAISNLGFRCAKNAEGAKEDSDD